MIGLPRPLRWLPLLTFVCVSLPASEAKLASTRVAAIRYWSFGDITRVAIQTEGEYKLVFDQVERPARVYFDLTGLRSSINVHRGIENVPVTDRIVKQIRVAELSPGKTRLIFDVGCPVMVVYSQLVNPDRLMIEFRPKSTESPRLLAGRGTAGSHAVGFGPAPDSNDSGASVRKPPNSSPLPADIGLTKQVNKVQVAAARTVPAPDVKQAEPSREQVAPALPSASGSGNSAPQLPLAVTNAPGATTKTTVENTSLSSPLVASRETPATAVSGEKSGAMASPAKRDSSGDRSLVRVLGLKLGRVVIDAGHGGHDTGTIGPNGLMEKDLVLDVALRLGKLLVQQLGAEVVYTRSGDVFIPLEERTKIANREKADLFLSIHANSSPEPSATGVETYFFNLSSDKTGLDLATRENATSVSSISDLNDLLHKAVLQNKMEESREFAQKVQTSLWTTSLKLNSRSRDRGVRHAPFVVLIGASMPSILAEIGFVSNPHDEKLLKRSDQRQRVADALCKGVSLYAATLSHVQLARAGGSQ